VAIVETEIERPPLPVRDVVKEEECYNMERLTLSEVDEYSKKEIPIGEVSVGQRTNGDFIVMWNVHILDKELKWQHFQAQAEILLSEHLKDASYTKENQLLLLQVNVANLKQAYMKTVDETMGHKDQIKFWKNMVKKVQENGASG
jgi:hypothetical protein